MYFVDMQSKQTYILIEAIVDRNDTLRWHIVLIGKKCRVFFNLAAVIKVVDVTITNTNM